MFPHHSWHSVHQSWTTPYAEPVRMARHFRRGPSRLLWFVIGGISVSWWMKAKERRATEWAEWKAIASQPYTQQQAQKPVRSNDVNVMAEQGRESASKLVDETIEGALSALDTLRAKLEERQAARGVGRDQGRPS